jgi:ornithine decarboxylase
MTPKLANYLAQARPKTPILVVDLDCVEAKYRAIRRALPEAEVYYAVKANPVEAVIRRLVGLGSRFDVASMAEVRSALRAGAQPDALSFGNTIKKEADVAEAFRLGVRVFAFDSEAELGKIARAAPGARVVCRILIDSSGAEWPLSRKFGCVPAMAVGLLERAASLGLLPWGLAFHVGSQQTDPTQWDPAVRTSRDVFCELARRGVHLSALNLGGGFPARYREAVPPFDTYATRIRESLRIHFGRRVPRIVIEPGRGLVGDAGVIETEVVLVARKGAPPDDTWVFVDVGRFGGLAETMDEMIRYRVSGPRRGPTQPVILAGPTCDSVDVLYERARCRLSRNLRIGDRLRIAGTGAYTVSYASVGFNGFPPLAVRCI